MDGGKLLTSRSGRIIAWERTHVPTELEDGGALQLVSMFGEEESLLTLPGF